METEPLLPLKIGSQSPSLPSHRQRASVTSPVPPSSVLCPLPEDGEISIPLSSPSTATAASSLKDLLIFGQFPPSTDGEPDEFAPLPSSSSPLPASPLSGNPNSSSSFSAAAVAHAWLSDPSASRGRNSLHRSRTAPAISAINEVGGSHIDTPESDRPSIVTQAFLLLVVYLIFGISIYTFNRHHFVAKETHPVVDALYFCIVTMCTIGYGDITPVTASAKIFSIMFVIIGFGFVDILLSGMVSYVLDIQESLLLSAVNNPMKIDDKKKHNQQKNHDQHQHQHEHGHNITRNYIIDVKKGRMRIRMKVALALCVVLLCIGVGTGVLRFVEQLGWLDSFYLSVMSVTTVGYGDRAFTTLPGRLFASLWLLVSTLAVARAFLYLAEARIDKRHRRMAKLVLCRDMTVAEFLAADMDNKGLVTKSEYVIYKLKEMGKISEKDIMLICNQFDKLDAGNCGKITLSDLTGNHH
ncbi:two-pore potassium channel 3-like [Zingiber officinale]|uniref:two-pore potassium channel 3-like n=1 Tax=Zingiber officinale TaxID=94328 RepID=UPI001C4B4011|nr:two-pore potassium channel 3-like [Zingiber officinale]